MKGGRRIYDTLLKWPMTVFILFSASSVCWIILELFQVSKNDYFCHTTKSWEKKGGQMIARTHPTNDMTRVDYE